MTIDAPRSGARPRARRRVMIDARYIQPRSSGIGRYTSHTIAQMLRLAPQLELELIAHPSCPQPVEHERVRVQVFDAAPNSLATRYRMMRHVDPRGAELFHSPFNFLPRGLTIPGVFTLHDIMWLMDGGRYCTDSALRRVVQGGFYQRVITASAHEAERVMTVSHASRGDIARHFPHLEGRVHVTYNGLDRFFAPQPEHEAWGTIARYLPPRKPFVLVVGQGSPYKNHVGAIKGFLAGLGDRPEVSLVLVRRFTRGPSAELRALMNDPRLASGRLVCLEYVSGEELLALYNTASAFLFPSLYEGFGLPPLEAMACGTPVVASDCGAPAEVCGRGAVQVDPRSPEAIGHALRRLIDDEDHRAEMIRRGFERAEEFTWTRSAKQVLSVYERVLGERLIASPEAIAQEAS